MKLIALVIFFHSITATAAISKTATLDALTMPHKNRLLVLKDHSNSLERLHEVAIDQKSKLQMRWRAITSMGQLYPRKSINYLQKYAESTEWYMRNAAMVSLAEGDRQLALYWAERLLNDKALMVRTSAVQALKKIEGFELKSLLWEKLNAKQNFHRGQSLWIRKHIAELLYAFAIDGEQEKFIKLLLDKDKRIHPYAIKALQKLTGLKLAKGKRWSEKRQAWISHFKNKKNI